MADEAAPQYWFHAKRYGWGWGLPATWQGWVAFGVYLAVVLVPLLLGLATLCLILLVIATPLYVWLNIRKGEPAAWRWGRR